jgi:DHA2 family multidrug resistance protein-like MFS transporter
MMGPVFAIGYGFGIATPVRAQVVLSAPPANLVGSSAAVNTATGQLGYALGITTSSVIVMQIADATFLRTLQQADVSQDIIDEVSLKLPDFATRAGGAHYTLLPQGMEEFAALGYASAWTDGMTQMFLLFGIAMLIGAAMVYAAMSRENRAPAVAAEPGSG